MQFPQGPATQPGKPSQTGVGIFEDRLQVAHQTASRIYENLIQLEGRLYAPRPSGVNSNDNSTIPQSVENSLNSLITGLEEVERVTARLLHG